MKYLVASVMVALICVAPASVVHAGTVGLWLFDELVDTTTGDPNPAGGERLYDETANQLHLTTQTNFGTRTLSTDRPAVMPAGTYSLDLIDGGASQILSTSSDLFHRGKTGELTIEFWYKPPTVNNAVYNGDYDYVLGFDGNDTGYPGNWGVYNGAGAGSGGSYALHFFDYSGALYPEFNTGQIFQPGGSWAHIAATIDASGTGVLYVNGSQVASQAFGVAGPAAANVLRLGSAPDSGNRSGTFLIDELRISDTALPAGNGSGLGELAWNTTLVPEPASMLLLGLGIVPMLRRRRNVS